MTTVNIFEYASRNKLRFSFKGVINTEQLWELSLKDLDYVYRNLSEQKKEDSGDGLLQSSVEDETLAVKMEVVKYIFTAKQQEALNREKEKEKKERNQKIMSIIAKKENEALENLSTDDLKKLLED